MGIGVLKFLDGAVEGDFLAVVEHGVGMMGERGQGGRGKRRGDERRKTESKHVSPLSFA